MTVPRQAVRHTTHDAPISLHDFKAGMPRVSPSTLARSRPEIGENRVVEIFTPFFSLSKALNHFNLHEEKASGAILRPQSWPPSETVALALQFPSDVSETKARRGESPRDASRRDNKTPSGQFHPTGDGRHRFIPVSAYRQGASGLPRTTPPLAPSHTVLGPDWTATRAEPAGRRFRGKTMGEVVFSRNASLGRLSFFDAPGIDLRG